MDPRAKQIFLEALERPAGARDAYVERVCAGEPRLQEAVRGLLRADERAEALDRDLLRRLQPGPAAAAVAPGQRIGPYVLRQSLGEGGFGVVYLADQEQPIRRRVALKLLRPGMDGGGILARFEAERQALARMDHPGICKVFDAGTTPDGRPYFVMEYVEGESIVRYCEQRRLSAEERLRLFAGVCDAVQHAHQKGVIHRDLKPSNVLVATTDGRPAAKVIDFGIAKATDGALSETPNITHEGQFLGTPAYMSPEQAAGSLDVDTRSDVYSLGALLYELLCGCTPFDVRAAALTETLRRIREDDPPRPSLRLRAERATGGHTTGVVGIPADLDWIVMRCLQKDRGRRYPTAWSLRADLDRHLANQPVEAAPPSRWYTLRKLARRHRILVGSGAAVLATLLLGIVGTGYGLHAANRARAALAVALGDAEEEALRARAAEEREAAEAVEARRQGRVSEEVVAFLVDDLLSAVGPSVEPGRGRDVSMRAVLDEASRRLEERAGPGGRFAGAPEVEATLRDAIGDVYRRLGDYREAEGHLRRALETREALWGRGHPETLATVSGLVSVLRGLGRSAEGEALLERFLDLESLALDEAGEEVLIALRQVALLRQRRGRHAEAAELFAPVLERSRALLGADDPGTRDLRGGLAVSYVAVGRYDDAEPLFRANYERDLRLDGPQAPATLASGVNLGAFLLERGRVDDAQAILEPVVAAMPEVLGPAHEQTLDGRLDLAILRLRQGRLDEAAAILEELIGAWDQVTDRDTHGRLIVILYLGRVAQARGDTQEAEALVLEARERAAQSLPPGHPFHSTVAKDLAGLWLRIPERADELEVLLEETLRTDRADHGPDHPTTLRAMGNLALFLKRHGRLDEAEPLLTEALERGRAVYGEEDPDTLRTESDLATLYADQERHDEALALAEHAARLGGDVLAEGSDELAVLRLRHGSCLLRLERHEQAEAQLLLAHAGLSRHRSPADEQTCLAAQELVELYRATGRADEARQWEERARAGDDFDG